MYQFLQNSMVWSILGYGVERFWVNVAIENMKFSTIVDSKSNVCSKRILICETNDPQIKSTIIFTLVLNHWYIPFNVTSDYP